MLGRTISHYKILEKLGEGGMGVVYKAHDTKLDRMVALKFLPPHLSASEDDKARFIQEAKAASALNHPNVCTIHDIQDYENQMFIVMEFVDGQTLRDRSKAQVLSLKAAIDIGVQIADGLAAAHDKGIVHRDIKPENIMIRKDGIAQIMDFGLAKLRGVSRLTKEGSTVGTAGYMSPEQVQGVDADHRSDISSLGVLLYELFAGQLPFKGVHETALSYEIVNVEAAPPSSVKTEIDPELDRIVLECLDKDPNERTQSVKQVAIDLKRSKQSLSRERLSRVTKAGSVLKSSGMEPLGSKPFDKDHTGKQRLPWIAAVLFFAGMVTIAALYVIRPPTNASVVRSSLLAPEKWSFTDFQGGGQLALSPDGSKLAFVAMDSSGKNQLWVRLLSSVTALLLPGTEGASFPFWSPDNRFIGYFAAGKVRKIEATGGPPITICEANDGRGGSWNHDGVIVFAPNWIGGLYKVSAAGGAPSVVTELDTSLRHQTHRWPWFLPDGKHFLYFARSSAGGVETEADAIRVASLDGTVNSRLFSASSNVAYGSGHIVFLRQSAAMAIPFDHSNLNVSGEAFPVADQVGYNVDFNRGHFTVSDNGIFIYQTGAPIMGSQLAWYDRSGSKIRTVGEHAMYGGGQLSPDRKKLAISVFDSQSRNRDIWIYDLIRDVRTRLTFDPGVEEYPVWSPDGSRIIYVSDRRGHLDIYQKSVSGEGGDELLFESVWDKYLTDCSPDGRFLLYYTAGNPTTKSDLWLLPLDDERKPVPILQTGFEEQDAQFSRDGKWIAYTSNESGKYDMYVRPFLRTGGKWQVSSSGLSLGVLILAPRWSRDGKEIFYLSEDLRIMVAEVSSDGSSFGVDAVKSMFDARSRGIQYVLAVSADGKQLLTMSTLREWYTPLTLVMNWDQEFTRK